MIWSIDTYRYTFRQIVQHMIRPTDDSMFVECIANLDSSIMRLESFVIRRRMVTAETIHILLTQIYDCLVGLDIMSNCHIVYPDHVSLGITRYYDWANNNSEVPTGLCPHMLNESVAIAIMINDHIEKIYRRIPPNPKIRSKSVTDGV